MKVTVSVFLFCSLQALQKLGAAADGISSSIPLGSRNKAPIIIGNQTFSCLLDTGSGDVWVQSFDRSKSSTFDPKGGKVIRPHYVSGYVDIVEYHDRVSLGDATIDHQAFGAASETIDALKSNGMDGVFGLSFDPLSKFKEPTFFSRVVDEKILDSPKFTFIKTRDPDTERDDNPLCEIRKLALGNSPDITSYCQGPFSYAPVTEAIYWTINSQEVGLSNDDEPLCSGTCRTVVDTGDSGMAFPPAVVKNLIPKLGGRVVHVKKSKYYAIDCDKKDNLPNITFKVTDEHTVTARPIDYVHKVGGECRFRINPFAFGDKNRYLIGQAFLDGFCVQFNPVEKTVGFAPTVEMDFQDDDCPQQGVAGSEEVSTTEGTE